LSLPGTGTNPSALDTEGLAARVTFGPNSPSNLRNVAFHFTAERTSAFECRVDRSAWARCASPFSFKNVAPGPHVFEVRAFTEPQLELMAAEWAWTADFEAPMVVLQATPPQSTEASEATFEFSTDEPEGGHFECRRDGGIWIRCDSPQSYAGLSEGQHTFEAAAVDAAGNRAEATYSWQVQRPPETVLTSGIPLASSVSRDVVFSFTSPAADVKQFECSLDGAKFTSCGGTVSYRGLSDGAHKFEVRAVDMQGLRDETPVVVTWSIDATGPQTFMDQVPALLVGGGGSVFSFYSDATDVSRFECQLDLSGFSICSSPWAYLQLGDGSHTFGVRAIDTAGNIGPGVSYQWSVDSSLPETNIMQFPPPMSGSSDASFWFLSPDGDVSAFECSLDAASFVVCTSPHTETNLASGPHVFQVRAIDNVGNPDPSPAIANWNIDLTRPDTLIDSGPAAITNNNSPAFTFSSAATDLNYFECSLDGSAFVQCQGFQTYFGLSEGPHSLGVRAVDTSGNVDLTPAEMNWAIDTIAPDTNIVSGPSDPSTSQVSLVFNSPDADGQLFDCQLDGAAWAPCVSPWQPTVSPGWHWAYIRARDLAGNVDWSQASFGWNVDTTVPQTILDTTPPGRTGFSEAKFTFHSPDFDVIEYACSVDDGAFSACGSPFEVLLTPGTHSFEVAAVDNAGNQDASPERYDFTVSPSCTEQVLFADDAEAGLLEWDVVGSWDTAPGGASSANGFNDSPLGNYADGALTSLTSKAIVVPASSCWADEHSRLHLRFMQSLELGAGDSVYVEVSDDGTGWVRVHTETGPILAASWEQRLVDLGLSGVTARPGEQVFIRFILESDAGSPGEGWAIDDIELRTLAVKSRLWVSSGGCSAPIVANIDGDSDKEVVLSHGATVRSLAGSGGAEEWSVVMPNAGDTTFPAVANVDGDAAAEIFVATHVVSGNQRQVRFVAFDGQLGLEAWRYDVAATSAAVFGVMPTVADWNQDGQLDVAFPVSNPDERLRILNAATGGLILNKHLDPLNEGNVDINQPVTLFDIDSDGSKDILVSLYRQTGGPRLLRLDGVSASSVWEYSSLSASATGPLLADVNNDATLEVVVGHFGSSAITASAGVQLWSHSGSGVLVHPAVADLNLDGSNDVVVSTYYGGTVLYALNGNDGLELWRRSTGDEVTGAPAIADVDGDGELEVLVGTRKALLALDGATGAVEWAYGVSNPGAPTLADVDSDGQLEALVCGDGTLHVISLDADNPPAALFPWPRYRRDNRNGGVLSGPPPAP
jgi:outer membrane protein assembly factor BamB